MGILYYIFPVPPEQVVIRDETNTERPSVIGPYSENDTVKIMCSAYGGKPPTNTIPRNKCHTQSPQPTPLNARLFAITPTIGTHLISQHTHANTHTHIKRDSPCEYSFDNYCASSRASEIKHNQTKFRNDLAYIKLIFIT